MPEQPAPEPQKSDPKAAPKAASAPSGADPSRASAYVPLPAQPKGKSYAVLALAALIAAGALGGTALHFRGPSGPAPIVAAATEQKTLWVSDKDIAAASTERVKNSPADAAAGAVAGAAVAPGTTMGSPGAPAPAAALPPAAAPGAPVQQASPPPAPAVQTPAAQAPGAAPSGPQSSPLPIAPPELVNPPKTAPQSALTPQGKAAVQADGYTMFQMQLLDDVAEDGDVVQIFVDGVPVSFLSLSNAGATLEIPLKKGESHQIRILAVRDGTGGVTLGLRTSVGDVVSRNLAVGQSDTWTIGFK